MAIRIGEFDLWRPGYGGAVVDIYLPGTTTHASVYTDEALSVVAANPQTLSAMESAGGVRYGKFAAPLYIGQSYYLSIDGIQDTGIVRPAFSALDGEDASDALVTPTGSSYPVAFDDLAGRSVNVANFGVFVAGAGGVAATNTTTMNLAIAALASGGVVNVPPGSYKVNAFNVPQGVIIQGNGIDATDLVSVLGAVSFTITGDYAGFQHNTLDGTSLSASSIAVKSIGHVGVVFNNVKIERFEMGIYIKGGNSFYWNNLTIINVKTAAQLWGETTAFQDLTWTGGLVSTATTLGLDIKYKDHTCQNLTFIGVGFVSCVGAAVNVTGAQNLKFFGCWGDGNTANINITDDSTVLTPATQFQNQAIVFQWSGGRINGGTIVATKTAQDVCFKDVSFNNVTITPNTPIAHYFILENCFEEGTVLTCETTKLLRDNTRQNGDSVGVTAAAVATKAWSITLVPGQLVYLVGKVLGKGRK